MHKQNIKYLAGVVIGITIAMVSIQALHSEPIAPAPVVHTTSVVTATAPPTPDPTASPARAPAAHRRAVAQPGPPVTGTGACGGDLPPCTVMMRESRGNINAYNPTGCNGRGCYGKWQCDPRTCDGTGTEAEQDAEARRVWAGGAGCSHWKAC